MLIYTGSELIPSSDLKELQQIKLQLNITIKLTFDIKKKDNEKILGDESCNE